jgi:hypothetical protein
VRHTQKEKEDRRKKERELGTQHDSRIYGQERAARERRQKEEVGGRNESAELTRTPGFMGGT